MRSIKKSVCSIFLTTISILMLTGCGDDSSNNVAVEEVSQEEVLIEKKEIVGYIYDSAVEGIEYRCGKIIGFTQNNGKFECSSLPLTFYIGKINLGSINKITEDKLIFPQDIVGVHRKNIRDKEVVRIALLLQSLDKDTNPENGIEISKDTSERFTENIILKDITLENLKVKIKLMNNQIVFKTEDEVIAHLAMNVGVNPDEIIKIPVINNEIVIPVVETNETVIPVIETNETVIPVIETNETVIPVVETNEIVIPVIETNEIVIPVIETNETVIPVVETNETVIPVVEINETVIPVIETNETVIPVVETNETVIPVIETNETVIQVIDEISTGSTSTGSTSTGSTSTGSTSTDSTSTDSTSIDSTAPNAPTLTITPTVTKENNVSVEVNGEVNASVLLNTNLMGILNENGVLNIDLNTSGEDGNKTFSLTLKDDFNNTSEALNFIIRKDTTAPATNSKVDNLMTDDTTPALSGTLPTGDNDTNTTNYTVSLEINGTTYSATNNQDGTWSLADGSISSLSEGFHDVKIIVSDEVGNESNITIVNKIEINHTGFLIDSAVEGIKYISGNFTGYTDVNGMFKYEAGENVTFYVGNENSGIPLGSSNIKIDPHNDKRKIITIFDLAGSQDENNQKVVNMGKFLQSLDVDKDVSNGITIDSRSKESIALLGLKNKINFDVDEETFQNNSDIYNLFNDLATHFGEHRGLMNSEDVKTHLVAVRDNNFTTQTYNTDITRGIKKEVEILTGVFQSVGGIVEGLEYRSGNQFGRTTATGEFKYEEGKKVKFYIYQLELGITEAKAIVTPADLVPATSFNHPKPRNIIRLLNAFDSIDGDSKVTIDNAVRESLEIYRSQIDLNLPDGMANSELSIPAGVDEFGTQFTDFEIGKEILDKITTLRGEN